MSEHGIDYDLESCLIHNPQSFDVKDIERVLAVWEGENDGDEWRWVLLLKDGRYVFLQGGCDYTGWDCQSWAESQFADTPEQAANLAFTVGEYINNRDEVYQSLINQLASGKNETWREKTDKDLGVDSHETL